VSRGPIIKTKTVTLNNIEVAGVGIEQKNSNALHNKKLGEFINITVR
jgi:hypothetical protein